MAEPELTSATVVALGPIQITGTVVTTWGVMTALAALAVLATRRLSIEPGPVQAALEGIVNTLQGAVEAAAPGHARELLPFIGSLWVFLVVANLVGLIPGLHSPTSDLSATAGLALLVFLSVHWYGIRIRGLRRYLRHYMSPNPILLPFHVISEITRTVALAVRLFGNIMSLELAALLILLVAGFLVPVPVLMLHVVEALVQAYIFGMLALVYIAGGIQVQELKARNEQSSEERS
ncbi:MAG: F0F1 ATP synthase subunit A [Gammaproteobacteria bacterium]|nr:F0F1 ATP synthase subunit A [Gammaproteobacteria bacterium]